MSLITVSRAFNPADAHVVRSRLDAAGFHAVVTNELSSLSLDGYAMAAGGILVQVPESEAIEAKQFLEQAHPTDDSSSPPPA
jgi:NADPH-dependent 7-cyano-7-deazaguanine reductase QueF-like protein